MIRLMQMRFATELTSKKSPVSLQSPPVTSYRLKFVLTATAVDLQTESSLSNDPKVMLICSGRYKLD